MEKETKEIELIDINRNMRKQQKNEINYIPSQKSTRKSVKRSHKKKKISRAMVIAGIIVIVSSGTFAFKEASQRQQSSKEEIVTEIGQLEYNSNNELSYVVENNQDEINMEISELADKMMKDFGKLSSKEVATSCTKRTTNKKNWYYDFFSYDKEGVTLNWLKKYFDSNQVNNIYNELSEEEINALIVSTTYNDIKVFNGGSDNKAAFFRIFGFESDKEEDEKIQDVKKIANDVSFRIAKESLSQKLGYSLDNVEESMGKGR